jgi:6-phosphogluconolactonase
MNQIHQRSIMQIYPDAESLSRAAAQLFVDEARQAGTSAGRFSVNLSGGSTPKRVFELLAASPFREQVPWNKVHVFWGDERMVPPSDPRSNAHMTRLALLDHVAIPARQVHPIAGDIDPAESARQYEALLKSFFAGEAPRFDLTFLGLGENGHTASLFPHTPVLHEKDRWVKEVNVEEVKMWHVTMTAPVLNQGKLVVFLAAGASKVTVLREVREGPRDIERLPAQLIAPSPGELRWMVDRAAAGQ